MGLRLLNFSARDTHHYYTITTLLLHNYYTITIKPQVYLSYLESSHVNRYPCATRDGVSQSSERSQDVELGLILQARELTAKQFWS